MATIGLDKLFYSKITEDADGNETYATPVSLAKAMSAELSVELAEATLYADDGAAEIAAICVVSFRNPSFVYRIRGIPASRRARGLYGCI